MSSVIDEAISRADGSALSLDYYLQWSWPDHIETALRRLLWIGLVEAAEAQPGEFGATTKIDHTGYVKWLIATHPDSPATVLDTITAKAPSELLVRIAENAQTWPTTLARLSCEPFAEVRIAVAENANTPVPILKMLATDSNADVRYRLAESPHLPEDILQDLCADDNPYVAARASQTLARRTPASVTRLERAQQIHGNTKRIARCM